MILPGHADSLRFIQGDCVASHRGSDRRRFTVSKIVGERRTHQGHKPVNLRVVHLRYPQRTASYQALECKLTVAAITWIPQKLSRHLLSHENGAIQSSEYLLSPAARDQVDQHTRVQMQWRLFGNIL